VRLAIAAALVVTSVSVHALPAQAQGVACRGYPESVMAGIKSRVEALRLIEREAADRLRGLDTRTFPYLAGEARKTADLVGDARTLAQEAGLEQCRNKVAPVRRICRGAALSLAAVLDEEAAGAASQGGKQVYAEAMPACERLMGLSPLSTAWRTTN